ncbi:hypothetical protein T439DRAFT_376136 [Meredithblackwellia eburnea MCA 4105]
MAQEEHERPTKKRKLPPLDDSFSTDSTTTNPEQHQGRIRTHPHVKGQWACHVYVELTPSKSLLNSLKKAAKKLQTTHNGHTTSNNSPTRAADLVVHSFLHPPPSSTFTTTATSTSSDDKNKKKEKEKPKLHISLSRPLMVQSTQRDQLRSVVAGTAKSFSAFKARYATFGVLENDDRTRRFAGVELGFGWSEMNAIVRALDEQLGRMRLPTYYDPARFHSSFVWTTRTFLSQTQTESQSSSSPATIKRVDEEEAEDGRVLPFGTDEMDELEMEFGRDVRAEELWVFELCLKVGKQVDRFALGGP